MNLRDKFLYGFLLLVVAATLTQRLIEGIVFGDILNTLFSIFFGVISWYLIIKLLFWIYDRVVSKFRKKEDFTK